MDFEFLIADMTQLFVEPACGERNICYNFSSVYVRALRVRPSGFVRAITSTFMHEFQNNLAQLFSLRSKTSILKHFFS